MFWSWSEDVHMFWILSSDFVLLFSSEVEFDKKKSCFVYLVILNNLHHVSSNITRQTSSGGGHKLSKFAYLFLF